MIDQLLIDKIGKYLKPTKIWILKITAGTFTPRQHHCGDPREFYFIDQKNAIQYLISQLHSIPGLIIELKDSEIYHRLMNMGGYVFIDLDSNDTDFNWNNDLLEHLCGHFFYSPTKNKGITVFLWERNLQ